MKSENKVKKLILKKETLRDLTAQNAGEVKGGGKAANTKKCPTVTCGSGCTSLLKTCLRTMGCPTAGCGCSALTTM
jgi:hypothetical protein